MKNQVRLSYYSDVLCFWAYAAQIRLDELQAKFAEKIKIEHHFISVFGDTEQRIGTGWNDRGGYQGFSQHIIEAASSFPYLQINPDIWVKSKPRTSASSHCFLKAVQLLEQRSLISSEIDEKYNKTPFEEFLWRVRCVFFQHAQDIGKLSVLQGLAEQMRLPFSAIEEHLNDGSALASLMSDMDKKASLNLEGSPSYILNEGRQKLYGNVGYRVIEANVSELLVADENQLSWC